MKKKILALTLALALSLSLAACGGKDAPAQDGTPDAPAVNTPEHGEPGAPEDGGTDGSGEPGTPVEGESQADVDLTAFYDTLRAESTWPELMNVTEDETMKELLDSYYPGLSEIPTKQCGVYIAAISAAVGELALVEVENAEDAQAVADIFQARVDYQVNGGAFYPQTTADWENAQIITHGNVVALIVAGTEQARAVEAFEKLFA